jgi:cytochrome P450
MVSPGFVPRRVRQIEDQIRGRVVAILDQLKDADTCDFVTDIAAELPIQMLAELLGVPQADRNKLFQWSNALIAEDDPEYRPSPDALAEKIAAMSEYALVLWKARLECPGDDLISMLVHSRIDGEAMTPNATSGRLFCLSPLATRPQETRSQGAFSRSRIIPLRGDV